MLQKIWCCVLLYFHVAFACKKVDHGPNVFEKTLPQFRIDPVGYGDRSFTGCTLLHKMIAQRDREGILEKEYFLTKNALNGFSCKYDGWYRATPLWMVVKWRGSSWLGLINKMIENGADVNAVPNYATFSATNLSILGEAADRGFVEAIAALLAAGADPNKGNKSPLMAATVRGSTEAARLLLEGGADPNLAAWYTPHDKASPLQLAKDKNQGEMIKLFNEFGYH